jgi:hypothetical protein
MVLALTFQKPFSQLLQETEEQWESKQLWMDYQCKLSPGMEIVYSIISVKLNYVCMQRKLFLTNNITC